MIIKAIAYAQSFQMMYVSLFVTIEMVILVKRLRNEVPLLGVYGGGTRLLSVYCSSFRTSFHWAHPRERASFYGIYT